jgi:hypothetical protein
MSELICKNNGHANARWKLLTGVSVLALGFHVASPDTARAEDADRPVVWIELGGQLNRMEAGQEVFAPAIMDGRPSIFAPSQKFEKPARYGFEETGAISVEPGHSGLVFSAAVRYGRSKTDKHVQQQTHPLPTVFHGYGGFTQTVPPIAQKFAETNANNSEQHVVLDFAVGKDVGLGLFGSRDATSVFSAGVRFAQFTSRTNISLKSDPDWHFNYKYPSGLKISNGQPFHSNLAAMSAERSFHGVGPSLSWKASEPIAGTASDGAMMMDWGLNAAVLFGRQKAKTHHQTTARSFSGRVFGSYPVIPHTVSRIPATPDHARFRSVTVPNIGGFAGLSFKYPNAKVSFGYRADFFFGAMDGGIDSRQTYDRNFYGPFASISVGLGG